MGLTIAALGTRVLRSMLYGVAPRDPLSLGLAVVVLAAVALVATVVPMMWASRTSAAELLRSD